ncbi:MAG: hypothetical protein A2Z83_06495 [Omnitrophica bacterium GWA2_52_8]|nr:MAG: hypothetical protein A2Z83_06495 [Omnitrophica bacterium GWA2_52_8]
MGHNGAPLAPERTQVKKFKKPPKSVAAYGVMQNLTENPMDSLLLNDSGHKVRTRFLCKKAGYFGFLGKNLTLFLCGV